MTSYHPVFQQVFEKIQKSQRVLLLSHRNPDGDTLGANLALRRYILSLGKEVVSFSVDKPRETYWFLPNIDSLQTDREVLSIEKFDLVIVLDCDLRYTGVIDEIKSFSYPFVLVNIDHHFTNDQDGEVNLVVSDASSTTTVLYYFFLDQHIPIDKTMALYLLTGIIYDTDGFNNPATNKHSLEASARLLLQGVRISPIVQVLLRNKSFTTMKLWGRALSRLKKDEKTGLATTVIRQEDFVEFGASEDATEGISNFLNSLGGVKAVLILKDYRDGYVKGSFRTTNDLVDVSEFAKIYGGGGHKKAAGFMIKANIAETEEAWKVIPHDPQAVEQLARLGYF